MNISSFSFLLHKPSKVTAEHAQDLQKVIEEFPYFQPARALQLKAFKEEKSFKYNNALKEVAAHTRDRSILFEFITSKTFIQDKVANRITQMAPGMDITELEVEDLEEVIVKDSKTTFDFNEVDAEAVMDPELFSPKESEVKNIQEPAHEKASEVAAMPVTPEEQQEAASVTEPPQEETQETTEAGQQTTPEAEDKQVEPSLQLGSPLEFDRSETHSFSEWLQLSGKLKPINREEANQQPEAPKEETQENPDSREATTPEPKAEPEKKKPASSGGLKKKLRLIDKFIESNPKIAPVSKESTPVLPLKDNSAPPHQLMTETLARVYLEQKKYTKAIQAYKILSLKYPEKSGLFADQIKAIKNLKDSNK
ncbi:prolipoprotein diacylglyceryl transferase [Robertkochia sediminum]|uniref:hypothetical protein n=1 Tax=Robertkochia sediminum TaxID=2785326 RepID=UPI001933B199|nr:hypothetical protein [Robertkochia sediminum]MBL7472974.1 hypothetical protein [Robertkochia sediminum]